MTSYAASLRRRPSPAPLRGHASDLLTILNPDTHYTIFDCITNLLDIKDILRLERTCSTVNWFLKKLKDTKWNIDQQLIRFFDNPSEFRSLQAKCDFLLSGRFVAGFFDRDVEMGTDLDVFISQESLDQLVKYLITKEGFKGGGQNQPEFSPKLRNLECQHFLRETNQLPQAKRVKIRVIICERAPPWTLLNAYGHTAQLNLISWNKAYSLFPRATFVDRCTYLLTIPDETIGLSLRRWSSLGWKAQGRVCFDDDATAFGLNVSRKVGDKCSWVIALECSDNSREPERISYVLDQWSFSTKEYRETASHFYSPIATLFESPVLRYGYGFVEMRKCNDMKAHLEELTRLEVLKLPKADRPRLTYDGALPKEFVRPSSWNYWDDEFLKWFERDQRKKTTSIAGTQRWWTE